MCIRCCVLRFGGLRDEQVRLFHEASRSFEPHPDPQDPLDGDVIGLEARQGTGGGMRIPLNGFRRLGWTGWSLECAAAELRWTDWAEPAWWEFEPCGTPQKRKHSLE
jgi:hypothetical protein